MGDVMNWKETAAGGIPHEAENRPLLRIAVPALCMGWRPWRKRMKADIPAPRDAFEHAFGRDLRSLMPVAYRLTPAERARKAEMERLRRALAA